MFALIRIVLGPFVGGTLLANLGVVAAFALTAFVAGALAGYDYASDSAETKNLTAQVVSLRRQLKDANEIAESAALMADAAALAEADNDALRERLRTLPVSNTDVLSKEWLDILKRMK